MPPPQRKSPFFTCLSTGIQRLTAHSPHPLSHYTLKGTFLAPTTLSRILVNLCTQPLPAHERHIRETSDQVSLPGYWVAPLCASYNDLRKWELDAFSYDILLIYCHGGAFSVGHALMYSIFMTSLITLCPKLRIRIYTIEYRLPTRIKALTRYPYQHRALVIAYKKLLEMGVSPGKVVIGGDSSGAFNVLKCFEELVDEGIPLPAGMALISPLVDLWVPKDKADERARLGKGNSLERNRKSDYVGPTFLERGLVLYKAPQGVGPNVKGAEWYAQKLPKTWLSYGTGEILMDPIQDFENGLREGKVDLTTFVGTDEAHAFMMLDPKCSKDRKVWEDASHSFVAWLKSVVAGTGV
jgi:acetyl esterase/lipase